VHRRRRDHAGPPAHQVGGHRRAMLRTIDRGHSRLPPLRRHGR
jgi:hypothetical protein